jgi:ADP-heptose:LPS heptosyltransferase
VLCNVRQRFPNLCIVQLGIQTSTVLAEVNVDLINQTTLSESAEILRHSTLHIDNESGLVHLAASLGVKSCVLFGPTSVAFFGYAANINIAPQFCGNCWWMSKDWMVDCFRGFGEPRCLTEQPPEAVATVILSCLEDTVNGKVETAASRYG